MRGALALALIVAAAPAAALDCKPVALIRAEFEQVQTHLPDSTVAEFSGPTAATIIDLVNAVPPATAFAGDRVLVIETPTLGIAYVAFEAGESSCGGVKLKLKLWRSIKDAATGAPT